MKYQSVRKLVVGSNNVGSGKHYGSEGYHSHSVACSFHITKSHLHICLVRRLLPSFVIVIRTGFNFISLILIIMIS